MFEWRRKKNNPCNSNESDRSHNPTILETIHQNKMAGTRNRKPMKMAFTTLNTLVNFIELINCDRFNTLNLCSQKKNHKIKTMRKSKEKDDLFFFQKNISQRAKLSKSNKTKRNGSALEQKKSLISSLKLSRLFTFLQNFLFSFLASFYYFPPPSPLPCLKWWLKVYADATKHLEKRFRRIIFERNFHLLKSFFVFFLFSKNFILFIFIKLKE